MRRNIFGLSIFVGFILTGASLGLAEGEGRYQLFQGKYMHYDADQNTSTENNDLFLLNTETGEVSIYSSYSKNGKQVRSWGPAIFDETQPSQG